MQPQAGQLLGRHLRLKEPLDRGAMGMVWVARHETLRTEVAVKFVDGEVVSKFPDALERFRHEASASARLKSPHAVQVFDHDLAEDGTPYIVMELLEGETLGERLEDGPLTLKETARVVTHVARALTRAHALGVVHRDIKPNNIFLCDTVDDALFCKVFDFGIAKQVELPELDGLTNPGTLVGTPEFMSPELFANKTAIDRHADLWALAVVAYFALSQELPFPGDTLGELCMKLMTKEPTPIRSYRSDLPVEIEAWFERALAKEPEDRFADGREFAKAFVAAAQEDDGFPSSSGFPRFSMPELTAEAQQALSFQASAALLSQSSNMPVAIDSAAPEPLPSTPSSVAPVAGSKSRPWKLAGGGLVVAAAVAGIVFAAGTGSGADPNAAADPSTSRTVSVPETPSAAAPAESALPEPAAAAPTASTSAPQVAARASASASATAARPVPSTTPKVPTNRPRSQGYDWAF